MQIVVNILILFSVYLLIASSFQLVYLVNKFFDLSLAVIMLICAYISFTIKQIGINFYFSSLISIFLSVSIYFVLHKYFILKFPKGRNTNLVLLITTLGLYVIFQNIVAIIWGYDTKSFYLINTNKILIGEAIITVQQIVIIIISLLLFFIFIVFIKFSKIGNQIRSISENQVLAEIFGIPVIKVKLYTVVISSVIISIASILFSIEYNFNPSFSFDLLVLGIVSMILGGVGNYKNVFYGSLLLASSQHIAAYYFDSKWMDAIAYVILILFLIWKPLGFSGKRLKKIEI